MNAMERLSKRFECSYAFQVTIPSTPNLAIINTKMVAFFVTSVLSNSQYPILKKSVYKVSYTQSKLDFRFLAVRFHHWYGRACLTASTDHFCLGIFSYHL